MFICFDVSIALPGAQTCHSLLQPGHLASEPRCCIKRYLHSSIICSLCVYRSSDAWALLEHHLTARMKEPPRHTPKRSAPSGWPRPVMVVPGVNPFRSSDKADCSRIVIPSCVFVTYWLLLHKTFCQRVALIIMEGIHGSPKKTWNDSESWKRMEMDHENKWKTTVHNWGKGSRTNFGSRKQGLLKVSTQQEAHARHRPLVAAIFALALTSYHSYSFVCVRVTSITVCWCILRETGHVTGQLG